MLDKLSCYSIPWRCVLVRYSFVWYSFFKIKSIAMQIAYDLRNLKLCSKTVLFCKLPILLERNPLSISKLSFADFERFETFFIEFHIANKVNINTSKYSICHFSKVQQMTIFCLYSCFLEELSFRTA